MDLSGKTILVTGASKGIGAAIARRCGEGGAHVIGHYGRDRAGAEAALSGHPHTLIAADAEHPEQMDTLWQGALAATGRLDAVVLNAAIFLNLGGIEAPIEDWDAAWDRQLRVNTLSPARLLRHAARHFAAQGGGVIVAISSWVAQRGAGAEATIAYAASKAALKAAAQTVARHYAQHGVLTYIVAPGVVRTQMSVDAAAIAPGGEAAVTAGLAMREWVPPEEIADLVAYLCTGRCRHLTGATLDVNGASYIR
jgi:NAD(P)-dependent dehydrogenase (short-subunit alcohol dehydrogenase family)